MSDKQTIGSVTYKTVDLAKSVKPGPLAGFRVLEFAGIGPAPLAAMILADLGATVLRLDRPEPGGLGLERPAPFNLANRSRIPRSST